MICTPNVAYDAVFRHKEPEGSKPKFTFTRLPVVLWHSNDDGYAIGLVCDPRGGGIVSAERLDGFAYYEESESAGVILPAPPGWWVQRLSENGEEYNTRIIAWCVSSGGWVKAVETPCDDGSCDLTEPEETCKFVFKSNCTAENPTQPDKG